MMEDMVVDGDTPDDVPVTRLLEQWREDRKKNLMAILEKFRVRVSETKMKDVLDRDETRIREILVDGLDVGTVSKYVVPVTLEKHPEHGWVFARDTGEMFEVSDHI